MHSGIERYQFIHELDQLLRSNEPDSLDKALSLAAQYLQMPSEDILAQCCSEPFGSLRKKLGQLEEPPEQTAHFWDI
jgi:hypothetical protein